jgi:hypothetical protein
MAKAQTRFAQVPLEVAMSAVQKETKETRLNNTVVCAICSQLVDLKHCKTDENGNAVHEGCYVEKIAPSPAIRHRRNNSTTRLK